MNKETYPDPHHDIYSKTTFGFWLYLLTDFILFAALFATYAVLHKNTFGGPTTKEVYNLNLTLIQTLVLLTGALTSGLGGASAHRNQKKQTIIYFALTFLLGIVFLILGFIEFNRIFSLGADWKTSGFLSAYFTVVGTFFAHILLGLLWIILLLIPLWKTEQLSHVSLRRITCLRMFWQFLSVVWVFIFTIIYLMGGT